MNMPPLILIIDDAKHNLQVLGNFLKKANYNITAAANGEQALALIDKDLPDLILLDILMPVMNGFELCKKIKEKPEAKDIPVIFLTALSSVEDIVQGFELGASDYITKPFNRTELLVRVKTHLEFKRNREELKTSNDAKDRFFSIIAHDLKNPFVSILSFIRIMRNKLSDQGSEELLSLADELSENVDRTGRLLQNLLEWSRQQIDTTELPMAYFDLYPVLFDVKKQLMVDLQKKKINLVLPDKEKMCVYGNVHMSETMLRNLISNAIKFSHQGQVVVIETQVKDNFLKVSVIDQGVGIKPETLKNLFRIDRKVTSEGTASEKGTGLGLILCKEFARKQGGYISVQSEPGKGSTFQFTLPLFAELST